MPREMSSLSPSSATFSESEQPPTTRTRKYRKHPKPDQNAPKKPSPSAYHLFAFNQGKLLREEGYSFEEIAKETGARWRALAPRAIRNLEAETNHAKSQYRKDVSAYEKTAEHRDYRAYLKKWIAKEEMKHSKVDRRARKRLSPPPRRKETGTETDSRKNSLQSIYTDTTMSDSTAIGNPEVSDLEVPNLVPDGWVPAEWSMPWSGASMSTADQLKWSWLGDFDTTLAPDPLFPSHPLKAPEMFQTGPMATGTVSPMMLTEQFYMNR